VYRDVITANGYRVLLLQQPYGAIAQTPGWGAAFTTSGTHTIYNAFEFLNSPGQFYFDKTEQMLYYYLRPGENIETIDVQAPMVEKHWTIRIVISNVIVRETAASTGFAISFTAGT